MNRGWVLAARRAVTNVQIVLAVALHFACLAAYNIVTLNYLRVLVMSTRRSDASKCTLGDSATFFVFFHRFPMSAADGNGDNQLSCQFLVSHARSSQCHLTADNLHFVLLRTEK